MKILLINNYKNGGSPESHYPDLRRSLLGHQVFEQHYKPGLDFAETGQDLIILSGGGGEGQEINDTYRRAKLWYEDQMKLVLTSKKPIIGICMGFEVISRAYGQKVRELDKSVDGFKTFRTTTRGKKIYEKNWLKQDEAHSWGVLTVSKDFEVLAESETGIEVIRHKTRPMLAMQFHPEAAGGSLQLTKLVQSFSG